LEKYITYPENLASSINGETPGGEQMQLGSDVLIYVKFAIFEQGVLNRLRANKETGTLANEIDKCQGQLYLGESDAIQAELHLTVDKIFQAIKAHRESLNAKSPETK